MAASRQEAEALLPLLPDAHAHPQLEEDGAGGGDDGWARTVARTDALRAPCVAAMGVAANVDWARVERLAAATAPGKVIPGFGIHPWWSHLHASSVGATWEQLLEAPSDGDVAHAVAVLRQERDKQQRQQQQQQQQQQHACDGQANVSSGQPGSGDGGIDGSGGAYGVGLSGGGGALDVVPHDEWRARLRALLVAHPGALVGEVGVDRAAVIPTTRARVRFDHQLALLREQLALAAELRRPVSVHCVRGYGHLLQLLAGLSGGGGSGGKAARRQGRAARGGGEGSSDGSTSNNNSSGGTDNGSSSGSSVQQAGGGDALPPAIMLHSYGGSPEEVARFAALPNGAGRRVFFSFSAAISARSPGKLAARIRAVPDDRLLLESDQVTPLAVDGGMADICALAAAAKGWSLDETARQTRANFDAFYAAVRAPPEADPPPSS